ncbi:hypothetical protein CHUAL_003665 [Chamberlinius hualienensis]
MDDSDDDNNKDSGKDKLKDERETGNSEGESNHEDDNIESSENKMDTVEGGENKNDNKTDHKNKADTSNPPDKSNIENPNENNANVGNPQTVTIDNSAKTIPVNQTSAVFSLFKSKLEHLSKNLFSNLVLVYISAEDKLELLGRYDDLHFLDNTEGFSCVRCKRVAIQHFKMPDCHLYCYACRNHLKNTDNRCIECGRDLGSLSFKDSDIEKGIMMLNACCPNSRKGCENSGRLLGLAKHVRETCQYNYQLEEAKVDEQPPPEEKVKTLPTNPVKPSDELELVNTEREILGKEFRSKVLVKRLLGQHSTIAVPITSTVYSWVINDITPMNMYGRSIPETKNSDKFPIYGTDYLAVAYCRFPEGEVYLLFYKTENEEDILVKPKFQPCYPRISYSIYKTSNSSASTVNPFSVQSELYLGQSNAEGMPEYYYKRFGAGVIKDAIKNNSTVIHISVDYPTDDSIYLPSKQNEDEYGAVEWNVDHVYTTLFTRQDISDEFGFSPYFYTGNPGYRLQAKFDRSAIGSFVEEDGKYVATTAVLLQVLVGEDDDLLPEAPYFEATLSIKKREEQEFSLKQTLVMGMVMGKFTLLTKEKLHNYMCEDGHLNENLTLRIEISNINLNIETKTAIPKFTEIDEQKMGQGVEVKDDDGDYQTTEKAAKQSPKKVEQPTQEQAEQSSEGQAEQCTEEEAEQLTEEKTEQPAEEQAEKPAEKNVGQSKEPNEFKSFKWSDDVRSSEEEDGQSEKKVEQLEEEFKQSKESYKWSDEVRSSEKEVGQSEEKVGQLEEEVGQLEEEVEQLEEEAEQSEEEAEQSEEEVEQLEEEAEQSEEEVEQSEEEVEQSEEEAEQSEEEAGQLEEEAGQLEEEEVGQSEETYRWSDEVRSSKEEVKQSEEEVGQSIEEVRQSVQEVRQSVQEIGQSVQEIGQSVQEIGQSVQEIRQSVQEIRQLVDEIRQSVKEEKVEQSVEEEKVEQLVEEEKVEQAVEEEKVEQAVEEEKVEQSVEEEKVEQSVEEEKVGHSVEEEKVDQSVTEKIMELFVKEEEEFEQSVERKMVSFVEEGKQYVEEDAKHCVSVVHQTIEAVDQLVDDVNQPDEVINKETKHNESESLNQTEAALKKLNETLQGDFQKCIENIVANVNDVKVTQIPKEVLAIGILGMSKTIHDMCKSLLQQ